MPIARGSILLVLCLVLALALACVRRQAPLSRIQGSLGVAAFTQPSHDWQLLGGRIPEWAAPVDRKVVNALDDALHDVMTERRGRTFTEHNEVRRCQEIGDAGLIGSGAPALDYWLDVARCAGVEYLVVPQLAALREKDIALEQPAAVVLDLFLVEVEGGRVLRSFHFEEEQKFLSENILDLGKFLGRGGRWITAVELAREGLERGIQDLWL